jgi:hypothetical protein
VLQVKRLPDEQIIESRYYGTRHEKNPDFENVGVHVYYIGGRIKGLKIRETPLKSWLLASLQFPKGSPSLHNEVINKILKDFEKHLLKLLYDI